MRAYASENQAASGRGSAVALMAAKQRWASQPAPSATQLVRARRPSPATPPTASPTTPVPQSQASPIGFAAADSGTNKSTATAAPVVTPSRSDRRPSAKLE